MVGPRTNRFFFFARAVVCAIAAASAAPALRAGDSSPAPAEEGLGWTASPQSGEPPAPKTEPSAAGTPPACVKADFETAVDQAAAAIRDLNTKNKPVFQDKLRQLKDKRAWSQDQFLKEAAPFVKDDQVDIYDRQIGDLLAGISAMGDEGSAAAVPDCTVLGTLRSLMGRLVETQTVKWSYMFKKVETELAK